MGNKRFFTLILALLCPIFMSGQNISIVGKTNKTNALVRLMVYDEMLTREQMKLAETQSDKDGKFVLKAEIEEITPAQIAIGLERVDIILSPNGKYDVEIIIPEHKEGSFFEKERPLLKINSADDGGLYSQYVVAESLIDDFIYDNFDMIYRSRKIYLMDTIENQIHRTLGDVKFDYVKNLIKYRKAAVVMAANNKKAISEYFDNHEVMYSHEAYMDVFSELFGGYFNSRDFNRQELEDEFYSGYDNFVAFLKKNDFLSRNPQICELVLMLELRRFYYENLFDKERIFSYFNTIEKSSKYLKNRRVARNFISQLNELSYNSDAPSFSLKDKNGKIVQLSDYQDDMVLLQFVDRVSPMLEHEFSLLKNLQQQWNDTIKIVTIATKESFLDYLQLFENQEFNWQILNLGDNILLLEDYHIKTCPAYVILKRKNRVGMAPAPSPDQYLDYHVRRINKYL